MRLRGITRRAMGRPDRATSSPPPATAAGFVPVSPDLVRPSLFDRRKHSTKLVHRAEFVENSFLNRLLDRQHSWGTGKRVHHVLEQPGFLENDRLRVGGQLDVFLAGRGERFVGAVAMARIGRVHVGEHQLDGCARQIVLERMCDERSARRLRVQLQPLRAVGGAENVAHADRPDFSAHPRQCQIFDVQPAIEEE